MAVLSFSTALLKKINTKVMEEDLFKNQSNLNRFFDTSPLLRAVGDSVINLLKKDEYVVLKTKKMTASVPILTAFIKLFEPKLGRFIDHIERARIHDLPSCGGENYQHLTLHNDNAVDLTNQPKYVFIQIVQEDPNGRQYAQNGVVKIKDVVTDLKASNPQLLHQLLTKPVPMLSFGVTIDSKDKSEIVVSPTILSEDEKNQITVRFDYSRIQYFFSEKGIGEVPKQILTMIECFLTVCEKHKKSYYLEKGDILIMNNLTTLHDRSESTMELNEDGSLSTRQIMVGFIV
ncbi:MAG: TauD/TfdA family dioxygenase [Gammaproteobacteria bacterium]|nr:TauD/TfdA family dioxygenase [Gammaproteobacteria bacterium]